ncbi:HAMP domain-containing histidine kinase [Chitinophaga oryzae]|uniref:histidine kinase n=1 Tax=Chitinophaga oryzae TaxID=2725414 RepID=A0AAE6ZL96_9BACT|nr:HAMP domain-containing histidine kinase [Chitinophaga oryzae]QJB35319.1 HAMP domain-containing histidine kinase [Chitinophaga oryzae]QJB41855.1 HAMP domain-containing histidine kinase [Chitinophaga oryzae]
MIKTLMRKGYIAAGVILCCLLLPLPESSGQAAILPRLQRDLAQQHDSAGYVSVLGKIGALYASVHLDSSFYYARQVLEIASRRRDLKGMADANNMLGWYYTAKTDYNVGIQYAYKALLLNAQLGDSAQMVRSLNIIYGCYKNSGHPEEANNYFYRAFHMANRLPPDKDSMAATMLVNYAWRFFGDSTKTDSVRLVLRRAGAILKKYPDSRAAFYVAAFEADLMVQAGKGKAAEERIYALADLARKKGMPYVAMDMYGRLYDFQRLGYFADSTRYQEQAYEVARQSASMELNLYWLGRLYDYYRHHRQPERVVYYGNEIMRLAAKDRYHNNQPQAAYIDFFLKEKKLEALSLSTRMQQQELEKELAEKKNRSLIVAGLLIIIFLLLALLTSRYLHYRRWKQQENALAFSYVQLAKNNTALTENDLFKTRLISMLATDFRTPLHHIIAVADQLKTGTLTQPEVVSLLKQIGNASRKTLDAFNNILKWLKLQLSGFVYKPATTELLPVIAEALEPLQTEIRDKQLTIVNRVGPRLTVIADREILQLVNVQLLQVAVTTARPGTLLLISSYGEKGKVTVRFMADGGASTRKLLEELKDKEHNIFALGIIISRDFMQKMKGGLVVEEEAEGFLMMEYTI